MSLQRSLGDRHPSTASSVWNNLAALYKSMGQYERALLLCESALEIYRSELGDRHPGYRNESE
jgi:tetratricopeptide (TPR) repeat protein